MFCNFQIDQFLSVRLDLVKRAFLVDAHQPAITSDISSHDRG